MKPNETNEQQRASERFYTKFFAARRESMQRCPERAIRNLLTIESRLRALEASYGYKYNPAEARIPAGQQHGGEWTSGGGNAGMAPVGTLPTPPDTPLGDFTPPPSTGGGIGETDIGAPPIKPTRGTTDDNGTFGDGSDNAPNDTPSISDLFSRLFGGISDSLSAGGDTTEGGSGDATVEDGSGDDTVDGSSGDDTNKSDPHLISQNDSDPNNPASKQVNIFIGGADDQDSGRGPVLTSSSLKNSIGTNYYYTYDETDDINEKIADLPNGTTINIIGHSWGGDTAANIVLDPVNAGKITTLITIDPVTTFGSNINYSVLAKSVPNWVNVQATQNPNTSFFNIGNLAADTGHWGNAPSPYATIAISTPVDHADFNVMMNTPNKYGITPQRIINRK